MKTISSLVTKAPRLLPVCFLALLIGGATVVHAQDHAQLGLHFLIVAPHGEFSENVTNNGYGVGLQGLIRIGPTPFLVGGDLGFIVYGSQTRTEALSNTIPDIRVRVRTTNGIFLPHFILRAQPRRGLVRPYVEGLIGLKYLRTQTSLADVDEDEPVISDTNLSDSTLSYGFGGGLQIPLTKGREARIMLDTGVRYLRGGRAQYLRKGSIREVNGSLVYDILSSRTDVLAVQIGVTLHF